MQPIPLRGKLKIQEMDGYETIGKKAVAILGGCGVAFEGLGLLAPVTGVCSMMGTAIPADSEERDLLHWVARQRQT